MKGKGDLYLAAVPYDVTGRVCVCVCFVARIDRFDPASSLADGPKSSLKLIHFAFELPPHAPPYSYPPQYCTSLRREKEENLVCQHAEYKSFLLGYIPFISCKDED